MTAAAKSPSAAPPGGMAGIWFRTAPFLIGWAFFCVFSSNAIPYSHDWEYTVKLSDLGFPGFLRDHYQDANGRLWVHLLIGLLGDHYRLGMLISSALLFVFPLLSVLFATPERRAPARQDALLLLIWLGLLLNFPAQYYVIGFFWITGALNYVWPSLLLLGLFFAVWNARGIRGRFGVFLTLALVALVAASHEMIALYGLMILAGRIAFLFFSRRAIPGWLIAGVLVAVAAFLSILLAPGNSARLGEDSASQSVLSSLQGNQAQLVGSYFQDPAFQAATLALLIALALYVGLRARLGKAARYAAVAALGGLILGYLALTQMPGAGGAQLVWLFLYAVTSLGFALLMLSREGRPDLWALMLLLGVMQVVPLFIPGMGPRVLIPQLLFVGVYALMLLKLSFEGLKGGGLALGGGALALLVFGASNAWALYQGYQENRTATQAMEAKIQTFGEQNPASSAGPLVLRRLPSPDYHWEMPYNNAYFAAYFYRFYGIDEAVILAWEGENTDARQRSAIEQAGGLAVALRNGGDSLLFEGGGQDGRRCGASTWQNLLVLQADLWGCSNRLPFQIEVYDDTEARIGDYAGFLAHDRYMVVLHGLSGPYSTHFVYSFGLNAERTGLDYEYRLNWLGRYMSIR